MPVYVERFILPILTGIVLVLVVQNLLKLTWDQRAALFVAVAASAYLFATAVHRTNQPRGSGSAQREEPPEEEPQRAASEKRPSDSTAQPPAEEAPSRPSQKDSSVRDKQPESQSFTVTSNNQQGGITAGIVNVGIPDYTVQAKLITENLKIDKGYRTDYRLTLQSKVVIPRIAIRVTGKTINDADMGPDAPTSVTMGAIGRGDGFVIVYSDNVFGPQILGVWTREPERLTLTVDR